MPPKIQVDKKCGNCVFQRAEICYANPPTVGFNLNKMDHQWEGVSLHPQVTIEDPACRFFEPGTAYVFVEPEAPPIPELGEIAPAQEDADADPASNTDC